MKPEPDYERENRLTLLAVLIAVFSVSCGMFLSTLLTEFIRYIEAL